MNIICTEKEYRELMEIITAGCCWIGSKDKVDIEKFKKATSYIYSKGKKTIEWDITKEVKRWK